MNPTLTAVQVKAVVMHLRDVLGDDFDDELLLDTLEGETRLFENVSLLLTRMERDEGDAAILKQQIDDRTARKKRAESRVDAAREAIAALMECAGVDKLPLPEATLSLRTLPAKLVVNAKDAVPEEYTVPKPQPDMEAIKAAFAPDNDNLPNWLSVEPERPSLTVRRK